MARPLPSTPRDVLQVSFAPLRLVIAVVVGLAERFGFWRDPLPGAAAAAEEMGARDNLYWIYKSKNPIARPERGAPLTLDRVRGTRTLALPQDMAQTARLTLGAGGDILRAAGIEHSKDVLFAPVRDLLFDRDVAYANFESPITEQPLVEEVIGDKGPPIECCSRAQFDILKGHAGRTFDVLNTANNHIFDMGLEGLDTTQAVLAEAGILDVGTNRTPQDYGKAKILERGGFKLGFVADSFGLNGHVLPEAARHRVHVSRLLAKNTAPDLTLLQRQIDDCREQGCDFVLASMHWGYEFEFFPRRVQVEAARALVEYGADSIVCHHPHVIQPVELYRTRRDPNRVAAIAYSLGSLTWGFMAPHIVLSAILGLTLVKGRRAGESVTYLGEVRVDPVFRTHVEEAGVAVTRIEKLADSADSDTAAIAHYADLVLGPAESTDSQR